ncbi:MAG: TIM barrel protein [Anaerolineae bacterium]|nr:sugar phosphate isomerase/epimerase [Anaerolineae bacterium]MDW8099288.1 TIM barrel protein [Anaerolineae bacterium]
MFALSSMWAQHRFEDVRSLAQAAAVLGFPAVELSHTTTITHVDGVRPGEIPITSVHYPAPAEPSPYRYSADALLSSLDETARRWAVAQGERSLQFAAEMGAQAVCVHLGTVEMPSHLEWALEQRYLGGQVGSPSFLRLRDQIIAERAQRQGPYLDAARRSLDELAATAMRLGVRIGIESRRFYREIPTWEELAVLLRDHDPQTVGFWYDMGHVQVLANLGFHEHQAWLDALADRIVGVHMHDVIGLRDHLPPGLGELDFAYLARHLPATAVRTFELDWYYEGEELQQGLAYARAAGCIP